MIKTHSYFNYIQTVFEDGTTPLTTSSDGRNFKLVVGLDDEDGSTQVTKVDTEQVLTPVDTVKVGTFSASGSLGNLKSYSNLFFNIKHTERNQNPNSCKEFHQTLLKL